MEQEQLSWYSNGLQAGWPGFNSQQQEEILLHFAVSRPALEPTQPPVQWVPWTLSLGVKWHGCEADHSPPPVLRSRMVELHLHSLIHLYGMVLN
jgi:hypothetical protein